MEGNTNPQKYNAAGIVKAEQGFCAEAEDLFRRAIDLDQEYAEAYLNLATLLGQNGREEEAGHYLKKAVALNPSYPQEFFDLGMAQAGAKLWNESIVSFCRAIELRPVFPEAYNSLGEVFEHTDQLGEAEACFYRAIEQQPDYIEAYNNLGLIKAKTRRTDEAADVFREAIALNSEYPDSYNNFGLVLKDLNQLEEAERCFRQAIVLESNNPEAYINLGNLLKYKGQLAKAEDSYRRAIELNPENADVHNNLGNLLKELKRLDEAESSYRQALFLRPVFPEARFALATLYLLKGQFEKGWPDYDALRMKRFGPRQPSIKLWQGEPLTQAKILLFHEQGFGDSIQFVRYAATVAALSADTELWVQEPLKRLIAASFPDLTVHTGESLPAGNYDYACPLPSLPRIFNSNEQTIPPSPYLKVECEMTSKWRAKLAASIAENRRRVGVVWAGNPQHSNDRNRSIPFAVYQELFALGDVAWISLQTGERAADLVEADGKVLDFPGCLTDFYETAGLINNLDLVISVDSAAAHLAGGLGKPVWLLLPYAPDWRWQLKRQDTPWYRAMRLFRQPAFGGWQEVIGLVRKELAT